MNHAEVICATTEELVSSKDNVILLCEGINDGLFGTIEGIGLKYPDQCIELPCSENASVGMVLGAACYGLLPILCYQRVEFALLALEQLFNNSSKIGYLSGGARENPALFRFIVGRGWGQGPSHSQSLESIFVQIPEVHVFLPVFPEDSQFIFRFFQLQSCPTISLEHRWVHYCEPSDNDVKVAAPYVARAGNDVTIVASSFNVLLSLRVAECASVLGISVEVVNLFCVNPIGEMKEVIGSAEKTGRLIFIDLSNANTGISNSYLSNLWQQGIALKASPIVLGCKQSFCPSSFRLTEDYYTTCFDIGVAIADSLLLSSKERKELLTLCKQADRGPNDQPSEMFKGPF